MNSASKEDNLTKSAEKLNAMSANENMPSQNKSNFRTGYCKPKTFEEDHKTISKDFSAKKNVMNSFLNIPQNNIFNMYVTFYLF